MQHLGAWHPFAGESHAEVGDLARDHLAVVRVSDPLELRSRELGVASRLDGFPGGEIGTGDDLERRREIPFLEAFAARTDELETAVRVVERRLALLSCGA